MDSFCDEDRGHISRTVSRDRICIPWLLLQFLARFHWTIHFSGCGGEAAFEQTRAALSGLTVRDALMHRFTVLDTDATLGEAVDALLNSQESEFVVADAGRPVGLLTRNQIVKAFLNTEKMRSFRPI